MKVITSLAILLFLISTAKAGDQVILTMDHSTMDHSLSSTEGVTLSPDYANRKNVWPSTKSPIIEVELKKGDTFTINIKGANKLLYTYTFSEVKTERTDNAKAVEGLLGVLAKFETKLNPKAQGYDVELHDDLSDLKNKLEELKRLVGSIERLTKDSDGNLKGVQSEVKNWNLEDLEKWFNDLGVKLAGSDSESIPENLSPQTEWDEIGNNDVEILELAKKDTLTDKEKNTLVNLRASNENARKVIREKSDKLSAFYFKAYPANQALKLLNSRRSDIDKAFKLLVAFQKEVAAAAELDPSKPISYSAREKQVLTLTITNPNKQVMHWTGTITIVIVPRERFNFKINPTVVYSFINTDTFVAKPFAQEGTIKYKITHTESDYNKYALGALWQVNPKTWDSDDLSASIDMGFAYDDKLGAVLGGSVSFLRRASIGMGVIAQQVEVLGVNMAVDQVIDKDTDLKLDKKFKTGFYLGLKVDLGK